MPQKVVYFLKNRQTMLLAGDGAPGEDEDRKALPALLGQGWRLVSISMTASAAVNDDQVLGIGILERA